jgi:alpha-N-arabinofuranosidase
MDELITKHAAIMDKYDPDKRVGLYVDEWGTWYDPEPGRTPGFLYQQNTLRDALVAALTLNVFHRHAERVRMANIAQMVNVLQAMILTDGPKMALTPTYHAFQMYIPFQGATALPAEIETTNYTLGEYTVPAVSVSAARDTQGALQLALVNLDPKREAVVTARVTGAEPKGAQPTMATGRVLTAKVMDAHNTPAQPEVVAPMKIAAHRSGGALVLTLPPMSVSVVKLQ